MLALETALSPTIYETHPSAVLPADHGLSLLNIGNAVVPPCAIVLTEEVSLFQRFTYIHSNDID